MLVPLRRPRRLGPGDRVAVIAPSGPLEPERLDRGCAVLAGLGLDVVVGAHARDVAGHLAGSDADRAADLQSAWLDARVRAVVCARGGYGAVRLLDLLDWDAMRAAASGPNGPPVFVGASDVTSLHLAIARHLGVATLFGPMAAAQILAGERPEPATLAHLATTLTDPGGAQVLGGGGVRVLEPGTSGPLVRGVGTGGTLALLAAAVGTPEAPRLAGGVLFLEDVGEPPYRIDRMLTQLIRAGSLDGVCAVVAGDWDRCGPVAAIDAVLRERLGPLGVPILAGLEFGHGPVQLTVPLGAAMTVDVREGTITLDEPALA